MRRFLVVCAAVLMTLGVAPSFAESASAPPAPKNLSVATERGVATLSWQSSPGAVGYNVYRNGKYLDTVNSKTSYRDGNRPGIYTYYVTAFDSTKKKFSGKSSQVRADTRTASGGGGGSTSSSSNGQLSAPNLKRIDTIKGAATLHFDSVPGAAGYNVYRNGKYLKTVTKSPYRDGNRAGIYRYYVTAFDSSKKKFSPKSQELRADTRGTSSTSSSGSDTKAVNQGLVAPILHRIDTVRGAATLHFSTQSEAAGYNVYRNGKYLKTVTSSPYRDGNNPSTYTYYVTAFDRSKKNFSSKSNELNADTRGTSTSDRESNSTTDANNGKLAAPNLKRIDTARGVARLHFDTVAGAVGYNVYRNGKYLKTVKSSPYQDRNSPANYTYYLTAFDSNKNFSSKSAELIADTRGVSSSVADSTEDDVRPPNIPTFIEVVKKPSFVSVVWRQSTARKGINVYRNGTFIGSVNSPGTVFNDRAGKVGDTYHLVAYGDNGTFSAESAKVFAEADVQAGVPPLRSGTPNLFSLNVRAQGSRTVLSWPTQQRDARYSVYRFRTTPDSSAVQTNDATTSGTSFSTPRASNELYLVAVTQGDSIISSTGLYNWNGRCIALCSTTDWTAPQTQVQTRAAPVVVIIVGIVIREAARRAARWCASNPRDCISNAQDVVDAGNKIYDAFIEDNPASVIASQEVDELKEQGFSVISEHDASNTITLQNGNTTVTIQAVETVRGEEGRVLTTTTRFNSDGLVAEVRTDLDDVSERLVDDAAQVDSSYTSIRTNFYHPVTRKLVGYVVTVYRDGKRVGTDCNGQTASSECSNPETTPTTSGGPDFTLPPLITTEPDNYVTIPPSTTEPENYVTIPPTTARPTTTRRQETEETTRQTSPPSSSQDCLNGSCVGP